MSMNVRILTLTGTFLIVFNALTAQKKDHLITAVAFYNLENLFDAEDDPNKNDDEFTPGGVNHYTEEVYQKKLHNLSKVLSEIAVEKLPEGPAIVGVAEVENAKVLRDLVNQPSLKDRAWKVVHIEGPDYRSIDVGLLYNPRYFKVLEAKSHTVNLEQNGKKERTRDILQVKGLLMGDTVDVLVGHWPSRRGGEAASQWKREKAAGVCKEIKDGITAANPDARVIVMGDLNDDPVSPSVVKVLGARGNKKDVSPGGMFNPFMAYYKKGLGTLGYNDSWNLFDQIIVSSGFISKGNADTWKFYEAHIFNRSYLKNQFGQYKGYPHRSYVGTTWMDGYSDHFPTYIYIIKARQ